jgi:Rieske 2Fe-2S family protein
MYEPHKVLDLLSGSNAGHTLPQPFYTDPDLFAFDMSAVFGRSWLMIGFEAELPEAGSHMAVTIGQNSVLLVRGRDGMIRGFHNTCRHRGSQICADGIGRALKLICPYHKWTYDLDGRLIGAARMPSDFRMEDHSLLPVRVERVAGCVYVALTHAAPDFAPFRTGLASRLDPYRLADAKVAFQSTLTEKANWKLVMENARECYHCAASHPELKLSYPVSYGVAVGKDRFEYNRRLAERVEGLGLSTAPSVGSWWHIERYPLNPGMESISRTGRSGGFGGQSNLTASAMRCPTTPSCSRPFPWVRKRRAWNRSGWFTKTRSKGSTIRSRVLPRPGQRPTCRTASLPKTISGV